MSKSTSSFSNFKEKSTEQFDQFIFERSQKAVIKELKENGIPLDAVSDAEMQELIAEEVKEQKAMAKGLGTGAASMLAILELIG